MDQRAREGDFLETVEGLIFDVKGIIHPPDRIIAYLRYYPDESGSRLRDGVRYEKVYDLNARFDILRKKFPFYLFKDRMSGELLQGVPRGKIKLIFRPNDIIMKYLKKRETLSTRRKTSKKMQLALELIHLIKNQSGINYEVMGISGSFLVNLDTEQSDIDLIIYGSTNAHRVKEALITLYNSNPEIIQAYSRKNITSLYEFRGKDSNIPFELFLRQEQRKKLQGMFKGIDFYIRCIKDWDEITTKYCEIHYESMGLAIIQGIIEDDTEALLSPCKYVLQSSKIIDGPELSEQIKEITSFRGRFCEQAETGEAIEARGKIELVRLRDIKYYRLLIGTFKEDYLKVLTI